jgi:predicted ferric reductase
MLRFINEEYPLKPHSRVVLHYLVRLRAETLFVDAINQIKQNLGNLFDGHIWITRQETQFPNPSFPAGLQVHHLEASDEKLVGQSWEWWNSFSNDALEHFDTKERQMKSLVYICGPQVLTDRLVKLYEEHGMSTKDGHVQIEKWW